MFGGDLPVMHQSRKWKRKMRGRPLTQRSCGCQLKCTNHGYAHMQETQMVLPRQRRRLCIFMNIMQVTGYFVEL
ncbi:hypothetical protein PBOR_32250 [Paenibacillus borealis]|uniref:Uncharacterized protein n=1 Tax=Paenibacillus borealis TaxID=160799 RepID=A0A089LPB7_PAEBO|nr:hypothetical protein PBOR_32250 [Paenibacillus borealis]